MKIEKLVEEPKQRGFISGIRQIMGILFIVPLILFVINEPLNALVLSAFLSLMFWAIRPHKTIDKKPIANMSDDQLIDYVQDYLCVDHVFASIKKVEQKRAAAGFMAPLLPFFMKVSYRKDEQRIEAVIHEHVHISCFIYGFQATIFYGILYLLHLIKPLWLQLLSIGFSVVVFLLLQEVITFAVTKKIASDHGIEARGFSKNIALKYIVFYPSFFITAILSAFATVGILFFVYMVSPDVVIAIKSASQILTILLFLFGVKCLDRIYVKVFELIDKKTKPMEA